MAALAGRQFNRIARRQLHALGLTDTAIEHRVATGRLVSLEAGVFAIAPVLGYGPAWISHFRVRDTSAAERGMALLMGSSACSMRSRTAGLFSARRPCCPPNARNRAPRTEPGLTTAAPNANTESATAAKITTTSTRGDIVFYTWIRIIFRMTK